MIVSLSNGSWPDCSRRQHSRLGSIAPGVAAREGQRKERQKVLWHASRDKTRREGGGKTRVGEMPSAFGAERSGPRAAA